MTLSLEAEVQALFRQKMIEFIDWTEENWKITHADEKEDWFKELTEENIEGYNQAVDSLKGAFEIWNEEFGP